MAGCPLGVEASRSKPSALPLVTLYRIGAALDEELNICFQRLEHSKVERESAALIAVQPVRHMRPAHRLCREFLLDRRAAVRYPGRPSNENTNDTPAEHPFTEGARNASRLPLLVQERPAPIR